MYCFCQLRIFVAFKVASNVTRVLNTIPLYTYYSSEYEDYASVATPKSIQLMDTNGYKLIRIEGYIYYDTTSTGGIAVTPLKLYWSMERHDFFLTGCSTDEQSAISAGYEYVSTEGYSPVVYTVWQSNPPDDCPFPQSSNFSEIAFSMRYGTYGHADTWYPSWGKDNNLYSSWTDGKVNGVSGGNSMHTTGYAVVIGDDPLNLTITNVGTFQSYPAPYHGRYPSANFVYDGVWYYGTYALDNPQFPPNPQPNCGNWCVQGPFIDFRYSTVVSPTTPPTWFEPRVDMATDTDNLFQETSMNNRKVKFGAPHVIDFGQELEHSPDKKVYIIGHGATRPEAHESWMQGDEIYLARGVPSPETINNYTMWEFYGGKDEANNDIWTGSLAEARPLFEWESRTGVVTMTYVPALNRYIMCVSTPSFSPYTVKQFDTYLLESVNITGPYNLITYMREFGPEAYFVNIPSKFADSGTSVVDGITYYHFYLSYSANFAMQGVTPTPVGSGYHWSLLETRIKLTESGQVV